MLDSRWMRGSLFLTDMIRITVEEWLIKINLSFKEINDKMNYTMIDEVEGIY